MSDDSKKKQETLLHDTEMGQKVQVERKDSVQGEKFAEANRLLRKMGAEFNQMPEGLEYQGSAAVHCFTNEKFGFMEFVTQTDTMQGVHELVGATAIAELRKQLLNHYGKPMQKKRSGF